MSTGRPSLGLETFTSWVAFLEAEWGFGISLTDEGSEGTREELAV